MLDNIVEREIWLHHKETVTQDIFVFKDQRDLSQPIRSLVAYVQRVVTAPAVPPVHLGVQMETSTSLKEAKVLQIANNAGEVTIAKGSRYWFPAQEACIAYLEL